MRRRAALRLLALGLSGLVAASCLAPTLPLPPPEAPDLVAQAKEDPAIWVVAGTCTPGATVTVFNERSGVGVVTEDRAGTGRYRVRLEAERCDPAWVMQEVGGETSGRTLFVIQERAAGDPTGGACE